MTDYRWYKRINPVEMAMLQGRRSPQDKSIYHMDYNDGVYINILNGEVEYDNDDYYKLGKKEK
jgi:hypothetical protein